MKLFRALLPFMGMAGLFILTGIILIIITDKYQLHLSANAFVGGTSDSFFKYYTHIGDGLIVAIAILVVSLMFYKKFLPYFVLGISTFILSGLLAQFFKRIVFSDVHRPITIFGPDRLKLVDGVDMHGSFSFPSGHSTASFALFIFVAFVFRKYRYVQISCAILAMLAAYSRVHISQHFIEDIVAGSILGISTFYLLFWVFDRFVFKKTLLD
ncbi:MAG: phosphatase PAP2 family protein [Crocinitomicaceae bacterium]|nr:phosphatase PAP2 family protein [Crocinitomicaceae bacterium]